MLRTLSLIALALILAAPVVAADLPVVYNGAAQQPATPPLGDAKAKGQAPTVINYPSAATQAAPAAENKNVPTVVNYPSAAGVKVEAPARAADAPATRVYVIPAYADVGAVTGMPYTFGYSSPAYGYGWGGYGYGGMGGMYAPGYGMGMGMGYGYGMPYSFGYAAPMYSPAYTMAYAAWAQPRPLGSMSLTPAGGLSAFPGDGMVSHTFGLLVR
jgi:hypothetical protein